MEEENFNWAEQLLGIQEKKDIKNSNAFKTLIDNNIDTNELTGHEKETEAGVINLNYKDDKEKEIDSYDYTKGLLNFVKDMPEETVKALMLASLNGVDVASNAAGVLFNTFTKTDPAMRAAFSNGDAKKFKESLNSNIKKFSDYLGTQKEEVRKIGEESETSSKAAEFVAMIAQDTPYAIPIYKKLKNIGVPNWMALPVSYGMASGIAFDDDATLFLNSEQVQEFKKMVVDLENSSEDKIFNTTFRMAEGTGLGFLTSPIIKALKYAKNNIPKLTKPQSTITVGGSATAGAVAGVATEAEAINTKPIDITKDYGGKYNVMEGEYLVMMRRAIEDLAANKITQEQYDEYFTSFMNEFPPEAIEVLKKDIANDGGKSSEIFGGKVNMNLKESELSTKPNNPKLYDFSKVKPEMLDVHEGDRIKALIDGLKRGESDKQLMEYLINEFDPNVIQMIKNELRYG